MDNPEEVIVAVQRACREGDAAALARWADTLERRGDLDTAALLRRLPWLAAELGREVERWRGHERTGSINLHNYPDDAWWFCGDWERGHSNEGDEAATLIGRLLRNWATLHPAVEWLARELRLPRVECELDPPGGGTSAVSVRFELRAGEHLGPLPVDHVLTGVFCSEA